MKYIEPMIEIIEFHEQDVIITSNIDTDTDNIGFRDPNGTSATSFEIGGDKNDEQ